MQLNYASTSHIPEIASGRYRTAASREHPAIARIERIAGRITEGIVAMAPFFWLALIVAFMALTLGIVPNG